MILVLLMFSPDKQSQENRAKSRQLEFRPNLAGSSKGSLATSCSASGLEGSIGASIVRKVSEALVTKYSFAIIILWVLSKFPTFR